jgi:hypothetical protein
MFGSLLVARGDRAAAPQVVRSNVYLSFRKRCLVSSCRCVVTALCRVTAVSLSALSFKALYGDDKVSSLSLATSLLCILDLFRMIYTTTLCCCVDLASRFDGANSSLHTQSVST